MSFLRVPLFILISHYLLPHLGFCKAYQNCLVALIKITSVYIAIDFHANHLPLHRRSVQNVHFMQNVQKDSSNLVDHEETEKETSVLTYQKNV